MSTSEPEIIKEFIDFCISELGIINSPDYHLTNNREDIATTAHYDEEGNLVKVYIRDRALVDVLRSIAHELVHHKQREDGRIGGDNPQPPDIGGPIEDEANAIAGQLIKKYAFDLGRTEIYESKINKTLTEDFEVGSEIDDNSENIGNLFFPGDGQDIIHPYPSNKVKMPARNKNIRTGFEIDNKLPKSPHFPDDCGIYKPNITIQKLELLTDVLTEL